jgi:hypothetical protein
VNPQLDASDAEDWERPAHLSQFALVLNRAPVPSKPDCGEIINRREQRKQRDCVEEKNFVVFVSFCEITFDGSF